MVDQQINDNVPNGGLQQNRHGGESRGISKKNTALAVAAYLGREAAIQSDE